MKRHLPTFTSPCPRMVPLALALTLLAGASQAANVTWNVGGGGAWDTGSPNWSGRGDNQYYEGDNATFNNTAGGIIAIQGGGVSPTATIVSATSGTYTFTGGPLLTGTLNKSGNGILILGTANSHSGATTLSGGTLQLAHTNALASSSLAMSGNGTVLQLRSDTDNDLFGTTGISISNNVAINVDQAATGTGNTLRLGSFSNSGSTMTFTNGNGYNLTMGNVTATTQGQVYIKNDMTNGTLTLGTYSATSTINTPTLTFNGTSATAVTQIGAISNASGGLNITQSGTGTTVFLSPNTYTGSTTISAGTLRLATGSNLNTSTLTISGTGSLDIGGGNYIVTGQDTYNNSSSSADSVTNSSLTPSTFSWSRNGGTQSGSYSGNLNVITNTFLIPICVQDDCNYIIHAWQRAAERLPPPKTGVATWVEQSYFAMPR